MAQCEPSLSYGLLIDLGNPKTGTIRTLYNWTGSTRFEKVIKPENVIETDGLCELTQAELVRQSSSLSITDSLQC